MNNICITGRLTSVPEIKKTTSGVSVCSVSIAVDRDYKVNGEKATDFIPCTFWRGTAEFVGKYFSKGDMIAVVGSLESRKYKDKDGNNRTVWEVKADKVNFCGGKKEVP
nr:MAG TPA: Single strand binding protein [Caudoviricetes sp.]